MDGQIIYGIHENALSISIEDVTIWIGIIGTRIKKASMIQMQREQSDPKGRSGISTLKLVIPFFQSLI